MDVADLVPAAAVRMRGHPLVHFALLGAVLFGVREGLDVSLLEPGETVIRISADDVARLRSDWQRDSGRLPREPELQASIRRHVDEELLLREALRLGLDRSDPVARERLINNMRFAYAGRAASDGQLLDEARALGMQARDLVVRRRLVQVMEMRIAARANFAEGELLRYVAEHPERYSHPARFAFRHAYFREEPDAAAAHRRARAGLAAAAAGKPPGGDPFLLGEAFAAASEAEIARHFGAEFARALIGLPAGHWSGPLRSPYGVHLVFVASVEAAEPMPFDDVRQRAAYALLAEREQTVLREELARLRSRYRIEIAQPAEAMTTIGMVQ